MRYDSTISSQAESLVIALPSQPMASVSGHTNPCFALIIVAVTWSIAPSCEVSTIKPGSGRMQRSCSSRVNSFTDAGRIM